MLARSSKILRVCVCSCLRPVVVVAKAAVAAAPASLHGDVACLFYYPRFAVFCYAVGDGVCGVEGAVSEGSEDVGACGGVRCGFLSAPRGEIQPVEVFRVWEMLSVWIVGMLQSSLGR